MGRIDKVESDLARVAAYWTARKDDFLDRAGMEFDLFVQPLAAYLDEVSDADVKMMNAAFSEWFLFERAWKEGLTPLEYTVKRTPIALPASVRQRLSQVCETQFFSRFDIVSKDRRAGMVTLRDTLTGCRYDVHDSHICETAHWRDGVIAVRIAYVDGAWLSVGQVYLYDKAPSALVGQDGPGAIHPEDTGRVPPTSEMTFFLRLVRDVLGEEGRYTPTRRMRRAGDGEGA